jgi:hypothetical protein
MLRGRCNASGLESRFGKVLPVRFDVLGPTRIRIYQGIFLVLPADMRTLRNPGAKANSPNRMPRPLPEKGCGPVAAKTSVANKRVAYS